MKKIFFIVISVCLFSNALAFPISDLHCGKVLEKQQYMNLVSESGLDSPLCEPGARLVEGCPVIIDRNKICKKIEDKSLLGNAINEQNKLNRAFFFRVQTSFPQPKKTSSVNKKSHFYLNLVSLNRFNAGEKTEALYLKHHESVPVTTVAFEARGFLPITGGYDKTATPRWSPTSVLPATVERDITTWLSTAPDGQPAGLTNITRRDVIYVSQRVDDALFEFPVKAWAEQVKKR